MARPSDFDDSPDLRGTDSLKWNTYPDDVLPLWVADMDFACPRPVVEALERRVALGVFGYPKVGPAFTEAVRAWTSQRYGWEIEEHWTGFLTGVVPGLISAVEAFTRPGDKVLIQSPVYPPFHTLIKERGRVRIVSSLVQEGNRWKMDFADLEPKLADPALKLFLLCNPHNPVGRVWSAGELNRIAELCLRHGVFMVSDEIHADIVYPPQRHIPLSSLSPEVREQSMVLLSPSKTFNIPGLRAAAAILANPERRARFQTATRAAGRADASPLGLVGLEAAYTRCAPYLDRLLRYLAGNIQTAVSCFERDIPEIRTDRPEATYLLWLDCRGLGLSQPELNTFMLKKAKVALNPGDAFGPEGAGFMRLNVACPRARLEEAVLRIARAVRGR